MTPEEAIATVPVGWRFLIERLYRQKPETCVILGVRRHGGRLHCRTSPPPPEYQAQVQAIERLSTRTCEDCGCDGGRRRELHGEPATLCESCHLLRRFHAERK
jgi:hypothetical protein